MDVGIHSQVSQAQVMDLTPIYHRDEFWKHQRLSNRSHDQSTSPEGLDPARIPGRVQRIDPGALSSRDMQSSRRER